MYLACIVGSFMILFAAAESSQYEAIHEMLQAVTSRDNQDDCNPSKITIKCCICLKMLAKYLPIINNMIDKKINAVCHANLFLWKPCQSLAKKIKKKVFQGFFPKGSCTKYKMCK